MPTSTKQPSEHDYVNKERGPQKPSAPRPTSPTAPSGDNHNIYTRGLFAGLKINLLDLSSARRPMPPSLGFLNPSLVLDSTLPRMESLSEQRKPRPIKPRTPKQSLSLARVCSVVLEMIKHVESHAISRYQSLFVSARLCAVTSL